MGCFGVGSEDEHIPDSWREECKIGKNWTTTNYKDMTLRAHYQPITSVKLLENHTRLISASFGITKIGKFLLNGIFLQMQTCGFMISERVRA